MARFMISVHFDPSFWQHVHYPRVIEFSMSFSCVSGSESVSYLGTSKKLSLGGVMSVQKQSLQTRDLAGFGISFIYMTLF